MSARIHVLDRHHLCVQPIHCRLAAVKLPGQKTQTTLVRKAVRRHAMTEILNSDQGSKYTCEHWVCTLKELGIQLSMDGKGRATDNAYIERFLCTLKRKSVCINPAEDGLDLYKGISNFMMKYNSRYHQSINRLKPIHLYLKAA